MSNMVNIDDLTAMATKGFAIYPNGGGLSAWNAVTGFEPMSVIRRLSNGRYKRVGMTFLPAGSRVERIKAGWHSVSVKFAN